MAEVAIGRREGGIDMEQVATETVIGEMAGAVAPVVDDVVKPFSQKLATPGRSSSAPALTESEQSAISSTIDRVQTTVTETAVNTYNTWMNYLSIDDE